jgi:hypothetical protein
MDFECAETADGMADKEVGEVHTRMKRVEPGEVVTPFRANVTVADKTAIELRLACLDCRLVSEESSFRLAHHPGTAWKRFKSNSESNRILDEL